MHAPKKKKTSCWACHAGDHQDDYLTREVLLYMLRKKKILLGDHHAGLPAGCSRAVMCGGREGGG